MHKLAAMPSNLPGGTGKLLLCHINPPKPSFLHVRQAQFPQHLLAEHVIQTLTFLALRDYSRLVFPDHSRFMSFLYSGNQNSAGYSQCDLIRAK